MIFARLARASLLIAVAGLLLLPGAASAQKHGGTLVMLVQPEPPTLAAYLSTSGPIGQVATKVYEGLLEYDFNLKPIPGLAESWKVSADGKTITFKLQKRVRFHDGKPLTSSDVKFSVLEVLLNVHPRRAIPFSDVRTLEKLPHIAATTRVYERSSPIVELDFNTTWAPFDNLKVRQAVSYAINRKFVIDNVWFGFGKPATGPISSNFAVTGLYTPEVKSYHVPTGIERANKLLEEAGFPRGPGGVRFEIVHDLTPYGEEWQRFGEYVQQVLAEIGIKATLRYEDVPTWLRRLYTDYDFQLTNNWIQGLADPVIGVHRLYHSNQIRQGTVFVNLTRWSSPRTDQLMDQATVEQNPKKRAALYKEFQQLVVEAAPIVWVHELHFVTVYNKQFKDLIVSPLGIYTTFDRAYLDK